MEKKNSSNYICIIETALICVGFAVVWLLAMFYISSIIISITINLMAKMNVSDMWADRWVWGLVIANTIYSVKLTIKIVKDSIAEEKLRKRALRRKKFMDKAIAEYGEEEAERLFGHISF